MCVSSGAHAVWTVCNINQLRDFNMSLYRSLTHTLALFTSTHIFSQCVTLHTHTHTHTYTQSDICSVLRVHMYLSRHVTRSLFKILKGSVVLWAPFTHMQTYKHSLTPAVPTGPPPSTSPTAGVSWLICCSIGQEEKQTSSKYTV